MIIQLRIQKPGIDLNHPSKERVHYREIARRSGPLYMAVKIGACVRFVIFEASVSSDSVWSYILKGARLNQISKSIDNFETTSGRSQS